MTIPRVHATTKPAPPPPDHGPFVTEHIPIVGEERKMCVVCYKREKKASKVRTYCSAPQCNRHMHMTSEKNCFKLFHSVEYDR